MKGNGARFHCKGAEMIDMIGNDRLRRDGPFEFICAVVLILEFTNRIALQYQFPQVLQLPLPSRDIVQVLPNAETVTL